NNRMWGSNVAAKGGASTYSCRGHCWEGCRRRLPQPLGLQRRGKLFERAPGEGAHIRGAIAAAGPQRDDPLQGASNGDAGGAGRVAVAVAGWSGGTGLRETPGRAVPLAQGGGDRGGVGLAGRPNTRHGLIADAEQREARLAGVYHSAAEEIGRGTGNGEERGADQATGRGFSNRDGLAALLQALGDFGGKLDRGFHFCVLRLVCATQKGRALPCYTFSSLTASDQGCWGSVAPVLIPPTRRTALAIAQRNGYSTGSAMRVATSPAS